MVWIHFVNEINKSAGNPIKKYLRVFVSPTFFNTKMFCFCSVSRLFPDSFYLMAKMLRIQRNINFETQLQNKQSQLVKPFEKFGIIPVYAEAAAFRN